MLTAMHQTEDVKKKDPAAVSLGRKGGKNSRKYLTKETSTWLAQKAAAARWAKFAAQTKRKQANVLDQGSVSDR